MRAIVMLLFVSLAPPCYAEDPLETLNTIEDTLRTMERTLKTRAESNSSRIFAEAGAPNEGISLHGELYFVSDEPLGESGSVSVRACTEEIAQAQAVSDGQSCVWQADGTVAIAGHYWKSRLAAPADLYVGAVVVARDQSGDGGWFLTRITDLSELGSGYLATSARLRLPVKGLRIAE